MFLESQPFHRRTQEYRLIDAATGEIERGWVDVNDLVEAQPTDANVPVHLHPQASGREIAR